MSITCSNFLPHHSVLPASEMGETYFNVNSLLLIKRSKLLFWLTINIFAVKTNTHDIFSK